MENGNKVMENCCLQHWLLQHAQTRTHPEKDQMKMCGCVCVFHLWPCEWLRWYPVWLDRRGLARRATRDKDSFRNGCLDSRLLFSTVLFASFPDGIVCRRTKTHARQSIDLHRTTSFAAISKKCHRRSTIRCTRWRVHLPRMRHLCRPNTGMEVCVYARHGKY